MSFREDVFLRALVDRPETAKIMSRVFQPDWLQNAEYQPVLQEIYNFTKQYGTPPTLSVLHEIFEKKDSSLYEARFQNTLKKVEDSACELADVLYTLDKARDVAISRSFMDMVNSPVFQEMNEEFDGQGQLKELEKWQRLFQVQDQDRTLSIKEAVEHLIAERGVSQRNRSRIPCGISFIDRWCAGGIRPKNLAILLAPTEAGKTHFLTIVANNIAQQGDPVLFITNEISMEESTERFMSKITGTHLDLVIEDPTKAYHGLKRHWKMLDGKLQLLEVNREIDSDEIEALVLKLKNTHGWSPSIVVIDYMERMKPTVSGIKRDQSWNWIGYIAKDLVRMAKRNNWLIWTAAQANRKGLEKTSGITLADAQGSIQQLQEAAVVIAMQQMKELHTEDEDTTILKFIHRKSRESRNKGETIYVEAKLGYIEITENIRDPKEWKEGKEKSDEFPNKKKTDDS